VTEVFERRVGLVGGGKRVRDVLLNGS
jgi:hypothetical protein